MKCKNIWKTGWPGIALLVVNGRGAGSLGDITERVRQYTVRIRNADGGFELAPLFSPTEETAYRIFDGMFMALHSTGRLYANAPLIAGAEGHEMMREYPNAVSIELLDYLSEAVLARFSIEK